MAQKNTLSAQQSILRALEAGSVVGVGPLLQRAMAAHVATAGNTAAKVRLVRAVREQILSGAVASLPVGNTVQLTLTRKGRRAAKALQPPKRRLRRSLMTLTMGAAALAAAGCSTPAPEFPSGPLMGFPTPAGVQQVRDEAGRPVFEPCNPCAGPSVKTPILGGYSAQDMGRAAPAAPAAQLITFEMLRSPQPTPTTKQPTAAAPTVPPAPQAAASVPTMPLAPAAPAGPKAQPAMDVLFGFATSRLSPEGLAAIRTFAASAKTLPAVYVRGATDAQGNTVANEILAKNRAAVVRSELISQGIQRDKIITSYCTNCYRASNDTEAGRQANRRVELSVTAPTAPAAEQAKR